MDFDVLLKEDNKPYALDEVLVPNKRSITNFNGDDDSIAAPPTANPPVTKAVAIRPLLFGEFVRSSYGV